jgi:hypothetical protein
MSGRHGYFPCFIILHAFNIKKIILFNYKISFVFVRQGSDEETNPQSQRRLINKRRVCRKRI